jgi:hypothetical protein
MVNVFAGRTQKDGDSCLSSERSGFPGNPDLPFHIILIAEGVMYIVKGTVIPLQAWTGPEGSRRMRIPDFKIIGIRW